MILLLLSYVIHILIISSALIYLYFKYIFGYWKRQNIPYLTPSIPYGNITDLVQEKINFGEQFQGLYEQGKKHNYPCIGVYFFNEPTLIVISPEIIKDILTKNFAKFHSRGIYYNEDIDPLSGHLVNLEADKWKRLRTKLVPIFTSGKMKAMLNILVSTTQQLEKILQESCQKKQPVDIKDLAQKLGVDHIGSCVFGLECNSFENPNSEFRKFGQMVFDSTFSDAMKLMLAQKFPFIFDLFRIKLIKPEVTNFFTKMFKETIDQRILSKEIRKDFIDLFIKIKNNEIINDDFDKNKMEKHDKDNEIFKHTLITYKELLPQAFAFFIAGLETISSTINYCLVELCLNKEIQDKLRKEINTILEKHDEQVTYEALGEMQYLDQVIFETLRKYPSLPILNRQCNEDYESPDGKIKLRKGEKIWFAVLGIHRDPDYYPDPDRFDPDRFTDEEKEKRDPYTYLPFGYGPRMCIAMRFALLEIKVGLISFLRNFKYKINSNTKTPIKFSTRGVFLSFQDTVWLDIEKA